jgi:hypothetical protein
MPTAGYSGTPLPRKLGIKAGYRVLVDGGPDGLALGPLPERATVHHRAGAGEYDVIVAFCPDAARVLRRFEPLVARLETAGGLWIAWPKRSSGVPTDLNENRVRDIGLAAGLVDVKVCAIDQTWSGLRFVRRLADR